MQRSCRRRLTRLTQLPRPFKLSRPQTIRKLRMHSKPKSHKSWLSRTLPLSSKLLLTCLLSCAALTSCVRPVNVPVAPQPCPVPAFHVQKACAADIPCLLTEFAQTIQAEQAVNKALATCANVVRH